VSELAKLGLIVGGLLIVGYGSLVAAPGTVRKWLRMFPRSKAMAWMLAAVDLVWAGKLLYAAPLGRFDTLKPMIYVLAPVAVILVGFFVDELLAPRALGGLFLLLAAPMLDIARWHASPLRLVITVLAYGMVIEGMILVVCPYQFRKWLERLLGSDRHCRVCGGFGCALGILILVLSLTVY